MGATTCTRAAVLGAIAVCNIAAIFGREFLTGITNSFAGGSGPRDGGSMILLWLGSVENRGSQRTGPNPQMRATYIFRTPVLLCAALLSTVLGASTAHAEDISIHPTGYVTDLAGVIG